MAAWLPVAESGWLPAAGPSVPGRFALFLPALCWAVGVQKTEGPASGGVCANRWGGKERSLGGGPQDSPSGSAVRGGLLKQVAWGGGLTGGEAGAQKGLDGRDWCGSL